MKINSIILISIILLTSCNYSKKELSNNVHKKSIDTTEFIKNEIISFIDSNKDETIFKNYFFLIEQVNNLVPEIQKPYELMNFYYKDSITVELNTPLLSLPNQIFPKLSTATLVTFFKFDSGYCCQCFPSKLKTPL